MKVVLLLVVLTACLCAAQDYFEDSDEDNGNSIVYDQGNGKPGCQTQEEFQRLWRNNWDTKRYWKCSNNGAVSFVCGEELMFQDSRQCCVHWSYWVWSPPYDPPTKG